LLRYSDLSWILKAIAGGYTQSLLILWFDLCWTLQAIAGEAGVPFFYRAGSEFEEM
jgi:hypothetical protein